MHCSVLQTVPSPCRQASRLFPFPVKIPARRWSASLRDGHSPALSLTSGVVYSAQAEPFVAAQSKREPAANPFAAFVTEASQRFGVPEHWIRR